MKLERISYFGSFLVGREEASKEEAEEETDGQAQEVAGVSTKGNAADLKKIKEMDTEVRRIGKIIKVEEMKEVWSKYNEIKKKREEVESQRFCSEIITIILGKIIIEEERDEEILKESMVNLEKQLRTQNAEARR